MVKTAQRGRESFLERFVCDNGVLELLDIFL